MDGARDAGIVALALIAVICLIVYLLDVREPTGTVIKLLSRLR